MTLVEKIDRYIILFLGLVFMAFGMVFTIRAEIGLMPILCIPYLFDQVLTPTIGQFVIIFQVLFVVIQVFIQKGKLSAVQSTQILVALILGGLVDGGYMLTDGLITTSYLDQLFFLLLGSVLIAVGVTLEMVSKTVLLSGDTLMLVLSDILKIRFGKIKMLIDIVLLVVCIGLSYIWFGSVIGIREGTIIATFLVGILAGRLQPVLGVSVDGWFNRRQSGKTTSNIRVITIARGFGSGGHEIGQKIAERLGWDFIDQQLIDNVAGTTGLSTEFIVKKDQKLTATERVWKDIWMDNIQSLGKRLTDEDKLFEAQSREILLAADKGNCVIVGRCANKILQDRSDCLHFFVSSDIDFACKRVMAEFGYTQEKARAEIEQVDESRSMHYNYYTGGVWGDEKEYDWCVKSSDWGIDESVEMMVSFAGL